MFQVVQIEPLCRRPRQKESSALRTREVIFLISLPYCGIKLTVGSNQCFSSVFHACNCIGVDCLVYGGF